MGTLLLTITTLFVSGLRAEPPVLRQDSARPGTIDDSPQGLDLLAGSILRLLVALLPTLLSAMHSRRDLVLENLALRQQLSNLVVQRHADIRPVDRVFWVLLRRSWSHWAEARVGRYCAGTSDDSHFTNGFL